MTRHNDGFWRSLRNYFTIYLPKQKNDSAKSIESCHFAWNLFLRYLRENKKLDMDDVTFSCFTSSVVTSFLDDTEVEKGWKASTRNQRLSCIRSFFKYASYHDPVAYTVYSDLQNIPLKKEINHSHVVDYMSKESLRSIISVIDLSTRRGIRDHFFIALMYDTAARDGEMLGLRVHDLDVDKRTLYLMGKGSKARIVPVSEESIMLFSDYKAIFHPDDVPDAPLFYTIHKREKTFMSDDNVARFLKKYADKARKINPKVPENVHPHMIRHSRAMHLYQSGMHLSVLSQFLGHEDPETTLIYAYADTEMKRDAVSRASRNMNLMTVDMQKEAIWKDSDIISRLIQGY